MIERDCAYCFFFNDTATTEIYTLSLHDALPISLRRDRAAGRRARALAGHLPGRGDLAGPGAAQGREDRGGRSEEHTSELQSRQYLVCRLLLEKKKDLLLCTMMAITSMTALLHIL